jgi:hypothetical protein
MHYIERWCLWDFCLSYYVPGQKLGGGVTGLAKRAGGGWAQNLIIILKILQKSILNSKINLKIPVSF